MSWFLQYPYVRWHIVFVLIPSIVLWVLYWPFLIRYKKTIVWITCLSFLWGFMFDLVASPLTGLWFFSHNLNIYFFGLPLEEYLFLLFVPQELVAILLLLRKSIRHG